MYLKFFIEISLTLIKKNLKFLSSGAAAAPKEDGFETMGGEKK